MRFLGLAGIVCCAAAPLRAAEAPGWIAQANNAFAMELYAKLAAGTQGNLFFSPNSIQTALAMTYAGARGRTADEMAAVLHLPRDRGAIDNGFRDFLKGLTGPGTGQKGAPQLSLANALWGEKGYPFLPAFLDVLDTDYGAGLQEVDFKGDSDGARNTINAWVEKETAGRIKDLIGPGALNASTRLVLANAIYFKGTWDAPFDKRATREEPFHTGDAQDKSASMMHRTAKYGYMENADFQALKLGYAGNQLSMIILLPRGNDGLARLEKGLNPATLQAALGAMTVQKVVVSIPEFKMTQQFELGPALKAMGMEAAFGNEADFSGMTGKPDLCISNVIHKAFVEVNEEGTVAAAATGVVMTLAMAMPARLPVFQADHPFFFVIRDEKSGAFLFMGRVIEPD